LSALKENISGIIKVLFKMSVSISCISQFIVHSSPPNVEKAYVKAVTAGCLHAIYILIVLLLGCVASRPVTG